MGHARRTGRLFAKAVDLILLVIAEVTLKPEPLTFFHILAWEGNVEEGQWFWFEGNFGDYEKNKFDRLGEEAARPSRVTHRKLTR